MHNRMRSTCALVFVGALLLWAGTVWATTPAAPIDRAGETPQLIHETLPQTKAPGDAVDFAAALAAGADYVRHAQADIFEDNAGNGTDGVDESPDDPDDGGWNWSLVDPAFTHSEAASSENLYGATAQGLYYAYLASGDPALKYAMDDAVTTMLAVPTIDSGADLIFLMRYNDLPEVTGTAYQDAARSKYDAVVVAYGTIADYAEHIRDLRAGQGYENGIIAWDIGYWAVAAAMLGERYGGSYADDAIDIAEVVYQDSFNDNPGYFDIIDDQVEDTVGYNNYWYNLGIIGLIDAFNASGAHTEELSGLVGILLESMYTDGAVNYSYGTEPGGTGNWQTTAYAALSLANYDQVTYQRQINKMAYWLAAWQDPASGGWVFGSGTHYPEVGGECTAALSFGEGPTDAIVDDDFTSQDDVDAYNLANGTDYVFGYDAFGTVQGGVDAVTGSTVTVLAGLYVEQVHITQPGLVLTGAGVGATVIQAPASMSEFFTTGSNQNRPVIFVDGADGVQISGLTVDGNNQGDTNVRFLGVGFWNAGGTLTNASILNIMNSTFSGAQHGVGLYSYNDTGGPYILKVADLLVDDFQKTAVALYGDGMTVDLDNVTTIGEGPTDVTAQNGISIGYGAGGTLDNCDVSEVYWTGDDWTASGVLLYLGGFVTATNVDVDACQTSIYVEEMSGSFTGTDVTNPYGDALYAYSHGAKAEGPRLLASPFETGDAYVSGDKVAVDVTLTDGTFTGTGAADSWGPSAYGYGPITFTVDNCEVTNWDWGIVLYDFGGASFDATVVHSNIHGNISCGLYSNAAETATASCNYWGDISGPSVVPFNPGLGDVVSGDVVYWPWLDAVGGSCTQYGDNNVAAVDADECLTPTNTCTILPVVFNRLDTAASRGVSVTFELSPELALCTGTPDDDITPATGVGSWSEGFTNIIHQVVDNGGGSYTVDRAILGTPCGPTQGGELFYVNVTWSGTAATDDVGTLTVTDVVVRDCANAPLPGIPGAPAEVNIDRTAPAVLADLVAAQVKTGNDGDGTTQVALSWTVPGGDADLIDIYRKGFGDYPEYDDGMGAVPVAPVTPANGWAHVATVSAASSSYLDEPTTRDFWYYAAFVTDACGNVSDVSAITDGTLNYHLGDVHDMSNPGAGDNLVNTSDISHLGYNYGLTIGFGDPLNYLDVGPTTDYSVDARPITDDRVQFEDLMMFAINYGQVSKSLQHPAPAGSNALDLVVSEAGEFIEVAIGMTGDGSVQGLSVQLHWDDRVVEPVSMRTGDLLAQQGGLNLVVSPEPGTVDAALFGVRDDGICGEGELAVVAFRVKGEGNPAIELGEVSARDAENGTVFMSGGVSQNVPGSLPALSVLKPNVPNPFNPSTEFSFVLARSGPVNLSVYTLQGRLVCTLIDESLEAGPHTVQWIGTDAAGRTAASGSYVVRMTAPDRVQTRHITLLK